MTSVTTDNAPAAIGPYSQAVKANGFIYTSGQIPLTPEGEMVGGDIQDQTRQVLNNLDAVLVAAGSSLQNVVKTTIYLADMDDFVAVNAVYAEFFGSSFPARSTVAVKTLPKGAAVEIDAIAAVDTGKE
ncbi:MAG: deaminase [Sulfurospirillum sp.]|nr:MAG: deaminase [Sulfurospirillum sp.]